MLEAKHILKTYWGFSTFRPLQEEIINNVLQNKDTIALLPTGGGKSICFQIPALAKEGICIVVSPLIALMKDQVENLKKKNIKAATIASGSSQDEIITLFDNIRFGNYKFLYLSPERLQSSFIKQKLKQLNINLIAIDEAHCISEWGHDFRPSYRNINTLKELFPNIPFIALTATANKKVLEDIGTCLKLTNPKTYQKSFQRENLAYQIFNVEDKLSKLLQIFAKIKSPAIVYVSSRAKTKDIATFLNKNNFKSSFYHAGLTSKEKQEAFDNWMNEITPIIVATNAFGMGIDKSNVKIVIHLDLPSSVENYIQESGRAGRNNEKSFAVLLKNSNDVRLFNNQLQDNLPTIKEVKEVHRKLYQHFRISNGELVDDSFNFNYLEFSNKYNFSPKKVDFVLKILNSNGVIEINANYRKKTSLQIIVSSNHILEYRNSNRNLKHFIDTLLRSYGGLFEQETKINEYFLSQKAGITSKQVFGYLKQLEKDQIIELKAINSDAEIYFLQPREDDRTINLFAKEVKSFIYQKKQKAKQLIQFVNNNNICRNILLLDYFNESIDANCNICDVCLSKNKKSTTNLASKILKQLENNQQKTSVEICSAINTNEKDILIHLRELLSKDVIRVNNQNKFYLKK